MPQVEVAVGLILLFILLLVVRIEINAFIILYR